MTSSSSAPVAFASSAMVGERPSSLVSSIEHPRQTNAQLLQAARDMHRPGLVPEVTANSPTIVGTA